MTGEGVDIETIWRVAQRQCTVELSASARERILRSRQYIEKRITAGDTMYGVNTGFGAFSSVRISADQIVELQRNLIRSHSAGVGDPFTREQTRAILFLRANALARGHSGVRVEVLDKLLEFLKHDILPVIPSQGSVGASGDLAPLAHLALALIGEGTVWNDTQPVSTAEVLQQKAVKPLELQAKEGLSLINGCQVMTAVGSLAAYEARRLLWLSDLGGAMTLEAMRGSRTAFDPDICATRPHPGEAKTARNLMRILTSTSTIAESHKDCDQVQDAYSLRCIPTVHGAAKDAFRTNIQTLEIEANSSTDNPLVFAESNKVLSCGNFHGEPVAFALDFMAIALSALASISECRIEKLINPTMSRLPAFLAPNGGLNSGLMIVQVAAAALVSENKILSHPASVDSIPTSADKEDHVSMGTIAARKFQQIVRNAENILAMELLAASQALTMLRPLRSSQPIERILTLIRKTVPFAETDRVFSKDIENLKTLCRSGEILSELFNEVGELEW
jgi:histidine ammonia-lyase